MHVNWTNSFTPTQKKATRPTYLSLLTYQTFHMRFKVTFRTLCPIERPTVCLQIGNHLRQQQQNYRHFLNIPHYQNKTCCTCVELITSYGSGLSSPMFDVCLFNRSCVISSVGISSAVCSAADFILSPMLPNSALKSSTFGRLKSNDSTRIKLNEQASPRTRNSMLLLEPICTQAKQNPCYDY